MGGTARGLAVARVAVELGGCVGAARVVAGAGGEGRGGGAAGVERGRGRGRERRGQGEARVEDREHAGADVRAAAAAPAPAAAAAAAAMREVLEAAGGVRGAAAVQRVVAERHTGAHADVGWESAAEFCGAVRYADGFLSAVEWNGRAGGTG